MEFLIPAMLMFDCPREFDLQIAAVNAYLILIRYENNSFLKIHLSKHTIYWSLSKSSQNV
jgi:hypothetical protein